MGTIPQVSTSDVGGQYFETIDGNEIVDAIDFTCCDVKAREWQDVWHEITTKQRGTVLLWQAVLLQEEFLPETKNYANTMIFKMNHSCIDGVSCIKFFKRFLLYLNGIAQGSLTVGEDISSLSLCPSLSDLLTRERPWSLWKWLEKCLGISRISKLIFRSKIRRLLASKQHNPFFVRFPPSLKTSAYPRSNIIFQNFNEIQALSTRIQIFLKMEIFFSVFKKIRVHT